MTWTPECDVSRSRGGVWSVRTGAEFGSADTGVGVARTPRGNAGTLRDYRPWIAIPRAGSGWGREVGVNGGGGELGGSDSLGGSYGGGR
jgi:hypothetical protein